MHFVFNGLFLVAAIKWGNWKNWGEYYPTILFFIAGDLLQNFLLYNHSKWTFKETIFAEQILSNHTIISLMIMLIVYPSTVLIYLGRFPQERTKQIGWFLFWVAIYSVVELINLRYLHLIEHHNGWSLGWSILFNVTMFFILRVHHKTPPLAWILSLIWIVFLWTSFDIPFKELK
ncbi:hypothetical protein GCM10008967_20850 [Bacillus carboniphilus]|uniref:Uncharacterized protein n=1 Tax=Bacillus carboniphilus TaxID=86663 RepID=A0ABP3G0K2_9BACI